MTQEITVEVSDLYAEMMDEVRVTAGEDQVRQQTETLIHQMYQQIQQAQSFEIEEPEDREAE